VGVPFFVAWSEDGARLFIPTQQPDALVLVDLVNGNQELDYRDLSGACSKPHVVEMSGADDLFVVCEGDQKNPSDVLKVDAATLDTVTTAQVGVYPDAFFRVTGGAP
jgi:hypothetical protein